MKPRHPAPRVVLFVASFVLAAFSAPPGGAASPPVDPDVESITTWMTGDFDTFQQVDEDEAANRSYVHVRAVMHIVPIVIEGLSSPTARAFYVEQAAAGFEDRPYWQRVYLLRRDDGVLVNHIFRIADPADLVGARPGKSSLSNLTIERLQPEKGCELVWTRVSDDLFSGIAGLGGSCRTTFRGASQIVSQVLLTPERLISLDQGFDEQGAHVWGPPPGTVGHVFRRRSAGAAPAAEAQPPRELSQDLSRPPLTL